MPQSARRGEKINLERCGRAVPRASSDIYAAGGKSNSQRVFMTLTVAACAGGAWWVLLGHVIPCTAARTGRDLLLGDENRRLCLGVALTIYFVRLLFTQFVFLKRAVGWSEAAAVGTWILSIYIVLAFAGATDAAPFTVGTGAGCLLFLLGSWTNSYAEYDRHIWKQRPENRGRLYTERLFRYARHPNYLGDLISFSGLCMIAGRWWTFAIPLIMLAGFVFVNIPMLDSHLRDHYGAAFDRYAGRTRKLIPFVY